MVGLMRSFPGSVSYRVRVSVPHRFPTRSEGHRSTDLDGTFVRVGGTLRPDLKKALALAVSDCDATFVVSFRCHLFVLGRSIAGLASLWGTDGSGLAGCGVMPIPTATRWIVIVKCMSA